MNNRASTRNAAPTLQPLSFGAGVQSTAVSLLACAEQIRRSDFALFAHVPADRAAAIIDRCGLGDCLRAPRGFIQLGSSARTRPRTTVQNNSSRLRQDGGDSPSMRVRRVSSNTRKERGRHSEACLLRDQETALKRWTCGVRDER